MSKIRANAENFNGSGAGAGPQQYTPANIAQALQAMQGAAGGGGVAVPNLPPGSNNNRENAELEKNLFGRLKFSQLYGPVNMELQAAAEARGARTTIMILTFFIGIFHFVFFFT